MKIKAYVGDNIKIHHIAGTEKSGITFPCILYDTYSDEQSKKIAKALTKIFTINLEEDKENNYEYKNNKNCKITINDEEIAVSEKEKTADEMFKELGYTKIYCEDGFFYYKAKNNKTILFNLKNKEWSVYDYDTAEQRGYGNKELEAILLKEYELGWLNWKNYKLELNNI